MGNSFVLFYVSIMISHGQFHCGNRGHTQNTDWVKSHFPVGKRSSGTATNVLSDIVTLGLECPKRNKHIKSELLHAYWAITNSFAFI